MKIWVIVPVPLVAVMVREGSPVAVGVPAMVAVPLPLSTKVTPVGRVPVHPSAGAGYPVVVTAKLKAVPSVTVSELRW